MDVKVNQTKSEIISSLVMFLLIIQITILAIILFRILNLEKIIGQANSGSSLQQNMFVDGVTDGNDPSIGPSTAPITIIEFSDFQCSYCAQANNAIYDILKKYGNKIRFVYRDFPLIELHPDAMNAALAARCADEQNHYWEMHDSLFASQKDLSIQALVNISKQIGLNTNIFENCLSTQKYESRIQADILDGKKYGVHATPSFFVNGFLINGMDQETIISLIDKQLNGK